jgi:hypothetical protein
MTEPGGQPLGSRPAVYIPGGYPLPYYAREDLAYLDTVYHEIAPAGAVWEAQVDPGFLEIILYGRYTFTTGPTGTNRVPAIQYFDESGKFLWVAFASNSVTPSSSANITFGIDVPQARATSTDMAIPIPHTILNPGSGIFFEWSAFQPDDVATSLYYTRLLIPTGPPRENDQPQSSSLIPTPLIL